jgi:hypothetical protein
VAVRAGALRFYWPDVFSRITEAQLAKLAASNMLGWSPGDKTRPAPASPAAVCGAAFGDSMTYGSEVADDEAWVHLLSLRLGCTVENFAVPAYGTDQALLRYEQLTTSGGFVILGLYLEMVRRSVAASWTFYALSHPMTVHQIKPVFRLEGEGLRLHPIPRPLTRESIAAHHEHDYYMRHVTTPVTFPYTVASVRAIYLRLVRTDDYRRQAEKYFDRVHPSGSGVLTRRLVDRFAGTAHQRNARPAVVLIPSPDRLLADTVWEEQFADDLRRRGDLCVIALRPHLRSNAPSGKLPTAPQGHYTASGNRLIADAVAEGLAQCGIEP